MDDELADLVASIHGFDVCLHAYVRMAYSRLKTLRYVSPNEHACTATTFAHMFAHMRLRRAYLQPQEYAQHLSKVVRVYDATLCKNAAADVYATCMADKKIYVLPRILENCIDLAHAIDATMYATIPATRYNEFACAILWRHMKVYADRLRAGGTFDTTALFWQEASDFAEQVMARLDYSKKIKAVKNIIVGT